MKTAPTLDSTLTSALDEIVKHLNTRFLLLVFVDLQEQAQTDREKKAAFEVEQRGFASPVKRSERHLVLELSRRLTRARATWLDTHVGELFDSHHLKDVLEMDVDALWNETHEQRKPAAHG